MSDEDLIESILGMNERDILELVLTFPEYLNDSYYSHIRSAIWRRVDQLRIFPSD